MYKKLILVFILILPFQLWASEKCLVCGLRFSKESSLPAQAKACEDLFGAACTKKDGTSKYSGVIGKSTEQLKQVIDQSRRKALHEMGFKSLEEAIQIRLKENGIEWVGDSNTKLDDWVGMDPRELYQSIQQCHHSLKGLRESGFSKLSDVKKLKSLIQKHKNTYAVYQNKNIFYYAKDIPNFIKIVGGACNFFNQQPSAYSSENRVKMARFCKKIVATRRKAVDLFRREGLAGHQIESEKFVRAHLPPSLAVSGLGRKNPYKKDRSILGRLKAQVFEMNESLGILCQSHSYLVQNTAQRVIDQVMLDTTKSKVMVEEVIQNFYTKKRKALAVQMYDGVRSDVKDLVRNFVKDPKKQEVILQGYNSLDLFWMQKPHNRNYTKINSVFVIDEKKMSPQDTILWAFGDPSLSFFTERNAFYVPSKVNFAGKRTKEQIKIMPSFIYLMEQNPYSFLATLAHEAGHKIGPQISKSSGYDISQEYELLLSCYRDKESINLLDKQKDEAVADYISSEVLARQIQKLPKNKRRQAVLSAVGDLCAFDGQGVEEHLFQCKGSHPEYSLRVSGIYGANPSIRKVMGCKGDSSKFKTCGMKTSILDIKENADFVKRVIEVIK